MNKTVITSVISSLVVGVFLLIVVGVGTDGINGLNGKDGKGAVVGPDIHSYVNVNGAFSQGGSKTSISTTSATYTLTFSEMDDENRIVVADTAGAALTLTLPASTSIPVFAGYRTWIIENAHTVAATTTTIAAGTGIDLQEPDGQNVVLGINNYAWLTCFREASTDVVCRIDETIPAD